jgi:hypothetical protein
MTRTYIDPEGLAAPKIGSTLTTGTLLTVIRPSREAEYGCVFEVYSDTVYRDQNTILPARCLKNNRVRRLYVNRFVLVDAVAPSELDEPI